MKFEIKSRFNGSVLFSLETESLKLCMEAAVKARADLRGADLYGADLRGADLRGADLRGADLRDADLRSADLRDADLRSADLRDADLRSAKIADDITVMQEPIVISGLTWLVTIWDHHMQIGCEFHSHDEWTGFEDKDWIRMGDKNAVKFRRDNMKMFAALCVMQADKADVIAKTEKTS